MLSRECVLRFENVSSGNWPILLQSKHPFIHIEEPILTHTTGGTDQFAKELSFSLLAPCGQEKCLEKLLGIVLIRPCSLAFTLGAECKGKL